MINAILDFLFPPKCPFCGELLDIASPVCPDCYAVLPFVPENACRICQRPLEDFSYHTCLSCRTQKRYFKHSFAALVYEGKVRSALLALKYYSHPCYAKAFAFLLADRILSSKHYVDFDYITFVPQNRVSKRSRGYNQAYLIAKELSKLLKLPCISTLGKNNDGQNQATIKKASLRKENVRKSYYIKNDTYTGRVLLVDDIYTTGYTANYCSRLLLQSGFSEVYLAIAAIRGDS